MEVKKYSKLLSSPRIESLFDSEPAVENYVEVSNPYRVIRYRTILPKGADLPTSHGCTKILTEITHNIPTQRVTAINERNLAGCKTPLYLIGQLVTSAYTSAFNLTRFPRVYKKNFYYNKQLNVSRTVEKEWEASTSRYDKDPLCFDETHTTYEYDKDHVMLSKTTDIYQIRHEKKTLTNKIITTYDHPDFLQVIEATTNNKYKRGTDNYTANITSKYDKISYKTSCGYVTLVKDMLKPNSETDLIIPTIIVYTIQNPATEYIIDSENEIITKRTPAPGLVPDYNNEVISATVKHVPRAIINQYYDYEKKGI